jgi:hypothetical protein
MSRLFSSLTAALLILGLGLPIASDAASRPRVFSVNYCWGTGWPSYDVCPEATLTLYSNGNVVAVDSASGATGSGRWSSGRHGRTITFTFPGVTYSGTQTTSGCYEGTMSSPNVGGGGSWAGCYAS